MSFIFSVRCPDPPDYRGTLAAVGLDDVLPEPNEEHPDGGPWPVGVLHFYRPELSARGVEVSYEDSRFAARINTLASPDDYDLAMRFVEVIARQTRNPISPEDGKPFPWRELRQRYPAGWVRATNEHGAGAIRGMLAEGQHDVLQLWGPYRPFCIGPRLMGELDAAGPADEFLDRLTARMLAVQNVGEEYFFANVMTVKPKKGKEFTCTAFGPGVRYLLPYVDRIAVVAANRGELIEIPAAALADILTTPWEWLDEAQTLVEPVPEAEWAAVRRRARKHAVGVDRRGGGG